MYHYVNGDEYDGEWKDNKRQGKGVYTCAATKLKVCSDPIIILSLTLPNMGFLWSTEV